MCIHDKYYINSNKSSLTLISIAFRSGSKISTLQTTKMELQSYFLIFCFPTTLLISFQVVTADSEIFVDGIRLNSTENTIPDEFEIVPSHNNASLIQSKTFGCWRKYVFTRQGQYAHYQSALYPFNYPSFARDTVCFTSPPGTTISVVCNNFNLPFSYRCSNDYLGISLDGSLTSYTKFCGRHEVIQVSSVSNRLGLIFVSGFHSWFTSLSNRNFRCRLTVVTPPAPPPPPIVGCNCGLRNVQNTRIVGGNEVFPHEIPWRCHLKLTAKISSFCGCSVISNQWIMTAAHCTEGVREALQSGETLFVVVGDHDLESPSGTASQQISVASVHEYPDYYKAGPNGEIPFNDISLLRLTRPITFSQTISPVCLPWNYENDEFAGTTVTASGWGRLFFQGPLQSILRKVDLRVLTSSECAPLYPPGYVTSNEICTLTRGKGICNGDSGGSIDLQRNGRHYAIGIISWDSSCQLALRPAVYAKVSKFLSWIQSTTNAEFCRA